MKKDKDKKSQKKDKNLKKGLEEKTIKKVEKVIILPPKEEPEDKWPTEQEIFDKIAWLGRNYKKFEQRQLIEAHESIKKIMK